jgi:hypothetical protein
MVEKLLDLLGYVGKHGMYLKCDAHTGNFLGGLSERQGLPAALYLSPANNGLVNSHRGNTLLAMLGSSQP